MTDSRSGLADAWAASVKGIEHDYNPEVDYFLDLRNYAPGTWNMDFRTLMPAAGRNLFVIKWLEASPLVLVNGQTWNVGIADLESGRLIAYIRGQTSLVTSGGIEGAPVFLPQAPIKLDRPRNLQFYSANFNATAAYTAAYGDLRIANDTYKNYATLNMGATSRTGGNLAIINRITPWHPEDTSTTQTEWTELQKIDLGSIKSLKRLAAYWSWYIETATDADAGVRIGYSTTGVSADATWVKTYTGATDVYATEPNETYESVKADDVSGRYLHVEAKTGSTANAVHAKVIIWFAWA